jgi:hypothetical protein
MADERRRSKRPSADGPRSSPGTLDPKDRHVLAAAHQADRLAECARNLCGWTVYYLKHRGRPGPAKVAARRFVDGAVTLGSCVIWNEVAFEIVGWGSQARMAAAIAYDLVNDMPEIMTAALHLDSVPDFTIDEARALAKKYASLQLARACLDISNLIPKLFDGPDSDERRRLAQLAWREFHAVKDPVPETLDQRLKTALHRAKATAGPEQSGAETNGEDQPPTTPAKDDLTLDDLAVALLTRWMKEARPNISLRKLAETLGCHRRSLDDCPTFRALWEASQARIKRGFRHPETGDIEAIDDD